MRRPLKFLLFLVPLIWITGCGNAVQAPNILIIVADDMGVETLSMYGIGTPTAVTPNLDQLAQRGMRFERFWSQPACSPTRAAILTGRYGFRTGVVGPIYYKWYQMDPGSVPTPIIPATAHKEIEFIPSGPLPPDMDLTMRPLPPDFPETFGPALDEVMLPQVLKSLPANYATAAIGKWHLLDLRNGDINHPNAVGFDYYSGGLFGSPRSYFAWRHTENGKLTAETGYIDQRSVDDASFWINQQGEKPWFMWFSFNSPHSPIHLPPRNLLHSAARDLDPDELSVNNTQPYFLAQIEAMDTLIGQLLDSIPQNTYVIFLGDNGTFSWAQPPAPRDPSRVKMTTYEGGVNVPLIITGPGIEGGTTRDPIAHVVDLFATVVDLASGNNGDSAVTDGRPDSVSMVPYLFDAEAEAQRDWVLTEISFGGRENHAIRDERFKLIINNAREEFYDLESDPNELAAIDPATFTPEQSKHYEALLKQLQELL